MNRCVAIFTWLFAMLLGLSSLLNGFLVFQQYTLGRDLQDLSLKTAKAPQMQAVVQGLVNDLLAYGQKQPAIRPLLQKHGLGIPTPQPSPSSPAPR